MIRSELFVFGGVNGKRLRNDVWALDLNTRTITRRCSVPFNPNVSAVKSQPLWKLYKPAPGNEKPPPRTGHVSVSTGDRIIVFVPVTFALYPRYNFL